MILFALQVKYISLIISSRLPRITLWSSQASQFNFRAPLSMEYASCKYMQKKFSSFRQSVQLSVPTTIGVFPYFAVQLSDLYHYHYAQTEFKLRFIRVCIVKG